MMRNNIIILIFLLLANYGLAQKIPKEEVRAVWITTAGGSDFPAGNLNAFYQQQDLKNIVDVMKNANFNTIVFQASARGDSYYKSDLLPWAQNLTGTLGKDPGYDPLAYLIDYAHSKGMEVHAWLNAFKAYSLSSPPPITNPKHIVIDSAGSWNIKLLAKQSNGTYQNSEGVFLDPANPLVRKHIADFTTEIIRKYDLDGIHFDFIRYNQGFIYGDASVKYFNDYTDTANGNPEKLDRASFQRFQVERLIRNVHDSLMKYKPKLKYGVTTPGIYRGERFGSMIGPHMDIYDDCFIDPRAWLQKGYIDYEAPQVYWSTTSMYPFVLLSADWNAFRYDRQVWIGNAPYRIGEAAFAPTFEEIEDEIDAVRNMSGAGIIFFRYNSLKIDKGIDYFVTLRANKYKTLSIIPPMKWKDNISPNTPQELKVENQFMGRFKLSWRAPSPPPDGDSVFAYNIYRVEGRYSVVDINNYSNLIAIIGPKILTYNDFVYDSTKNYTYAVTASDRLANESKSSNAVSSDINSRLERVTDNFELYQNYPNPFNAGTKIKIKLVENSKIDLQIFNALGQKVINLYSGNMSKGFYEYEWNGKNINGNSAPSGVYFCRLSISSQENLSRTLVLQKSMVLLK